MQKELLDQLREALDTSQANQIGHSGWIGFDMFCEYNELVYRRNSRIISRTNSSKTSFLGTEAVGTEVSNGRGIH